MKTLVIYDAGEGEIRFALLEGDLSHWNGYWINCTSIPDSIQDEMAEALYGKDQYRLQSTFPEGLLPEGVKVVVCGMIP